MHTLDFLSAAVELKCVYHLLSRTDAALCLSVTMKDVHVLLCIRTDSAGFYGRVSSFAEKRTSTSIVMCHAIELN